MFACRVSLFYGTEGNEREGRTRPNTLLRKGIKGFGRSEITLGVLNAQPCFHLLIEKSLAGTVGLDPFAVNDELRDSALSNLPDQLFRRTRRGRNVDLFIGDVVLVQEAFGFAAVWAPESGINNKLHTPILDANSHQPRIGNEVGGKTSLSDPGKQQPPAWRWRLLMKPSCC